MAAARITVLVCALLCPAVAGLKSQQLRGQASNPMDVTTAAPDTTADDGTTAADDDGTTADDVTTAEPTFFGSFNGAAVAGAATTRRVAIGPFATEADACTYCFSSHTKHLVAPECVCAAYPDSEASGDVNMFCSTSPDGMNFVQENGGCVCNKKNMEEMGAVTCDAIKD